MRRRIASLVGLLSAAAFLVSCGDNTRKTFPTGPQPGDRSNKSNGTSPSTCTTLSALQGLANAVFGAGSPNAQSALGKLSNMDKQLQQGNLAQAQAQAQNIVAFVQQKAGQGTLPGTTAQIDAFLGGVLCYVGLSPDTFLILPTDNPQVIKTGAGNAGLSLQGNTVTVPTLITINTLPGNANPLVTKLDQYPGFIDVTASSGLTKQAVVGVCPSTVIPQDVLGRLRLGHQSSTNGFEITPAADASFLDCSTQTAQSHLPEWLQRLASVVLPTTLYAKPPSAGGIGGTVGQFSPFAPVDPLLTVVGGVGGTGGQFQRAPSDSLRFPSAPKAPGSPSFSLTPGNRSNTVNSSGQCVSIDATVGNPTEVACRPTVTLTTRNGTLLTNVPVNWAVTAGGGTIAPEVTATQTCGTFGTTAATTTDANATAAICWTLGATPGTNTAVATPTTGGDVPAGASFSPPTIIFTATADQIVPTATATGGTFTYDTKQHAGSGTCSNSLTPALSYSGDGSVPTNVGTYTLTVTCGAGNPTYVTVTQTATIQITPAGTTTTLTCPTTPVLFTNAALTPCTATVAGPGLSQSVTPQYSNNTNVGTATVTANYTGVGNYQSSSTSGSFAIGPAPTSTVVSCPGTVPFNGAAQTPCSATVSGPGLSTSATVGYSANVNAGPVTATASYAGGGNYQGSSGSATFQIGAVATTASVSCPLSVTYTGSAVTPCTGSVTGIGGLNQSVTPTYTNNVVGQATATVNYAGGGNYLPSSASKTFQILYVQNGCFASPVYSVMPSTKSFQNPGSNLPIKCTLDNAQNVGVTNAQGAILVEDLGSNGTSTPTTVVSVPNAFSVSGSGNYSYGLNTGLAGFISGHFYRITATWTDGSTTVGFFFIK